MPPKKDEYTDETLESVPNDATTFICGMGAVPEIRTILAAGGMTEQDVEEGQRLLLAALAVPTAPAPEKDTADARAQRAAVAALDNWDEPYFRKYKASLERHHPNVAEYVFNDLAAARGSASVAGVATFLARIDALETGSDSARSDVRTSDAEAVKLLAKRGLTTQERKRLADLVKVALGPTSPLGEVPTDDFAAVRRGKLLELKRWLNEWTAVAHADIKKKAYLIRLGLATRRAPKGPEIL